MKILNRLSAYKFIYFFFSAVVTTGRFIIQWSLVWNPNYLQGFFDRFPLYWKLIKCFQIWWYIHADENGNYTRRPGTPIDPPKQINHSIQLEYNQIFQLFFEQKIMPSNLKVSVNPKVVIKGLGVAWKDWNLIFTMINNNLPLYKNITLQKSKQSKSDKCIDT